MTAPVRAALYPRASTGRQADSDLSIPDQRRQANGYCASRGWEIVVDYVESGASATDDRRPEFQRMIEAATAKPPAFDLILVHSFSRFFRDQFQLEFYVRRLAKNGVRLVSITQELGDDPMSNMIRQIMALFDEYQSCENAKHTLRAMKENARQGFWNGALPPIGYRIVEAAEQRGHRVKKTREIDPIQAETVRLIFRLAREGDGSSGPMGVKNISKHLNAAGIRTRDGGRWGVGAVHGVLTRTTYVGRHRFNTKFWKTRERKPDAEVVEMAVPPIIVADHIERRLLQPARLEQILASVLDRRKERAGRRTSHIAELRKRAAEADAKLKRLYDAIENGIADGAKSVAAAEISAVPLRGAAKLPRRRSETAGELSGFSYYQGPLYRHPGRHYDFDQFRGA